MVSSEYDLIHTHIERKTFELYNIGFMWCIYYNQYNVMDFANSIRKKDALL